MGQSKQRRAGKSGEARKFGAARRPLEQGICTSRGAPHQLHERRIGKIANSRFANSADHHGEVFAGRGFAHQGMISFLTLDHLLNAVMF